METTKNNKYVGECLKEFLKEQKLVQEDVASKLGVSYQRVNALLNGTPFGKKVAAQWEILFGINAYWLLTGKGAMLTNGTTPDYARRIIAQCNGSATEVAPSTPSVVVSTGNIVGNGNSVAGGNISLPVATEPDSEVIDAEVVELPIVPTSVVRQPETRLSKWLDKYSDEVERLRLSEIISGASMVREVKDKDMCPALKMGQYIYLELMPREMPIKNGRIYFVDHKKVEGFFRRLYDRGDSIECRADKPAIEPNIYSKDDIYDIYKVVGVFSTDIIDDEDVLTKDRQIASLTEQLNRLMAQQDVHSQNTAEALASTNRAIEQSREIVAQLDKASARQDRLIELLEQKHK